MVSLLAGINHHIHENTVDRMQVLQPMSGTMALILSGNRLTVVLKEIICFVSWLHYTEGIIESDVS